MNITFLITDLNSGGAEWQLARLAVDLQRLGNRVQACALFGDGEAAEWLRTQGLTVTVIGFDRSWKVWRLGRLFRLLRRERPDILHTWMFHANLTGKLSGRAAGVKSIIAGLRVAEKQRPYHVTLERLTAGLNKLITVNSPGLLRFAVENGFAPGKLRFIPNSVDVDRFRFSLPQPPAAGEPWKLLFLGRISPQKGIPYLIRAISLLKPKQNLLLDMVGVPDSEKDLHELEHLIQELGLTENVVLKPPVAHKKIPELLHGYHLLLLPSLWEGMPNAVMEAAAAGLPVVATDIEGSHDLVQNESTGRICNAADAEDLARAVNDALNNYDSSLQYAVQARRLMEDDYSPAAVAARFNDLYKEIASDSE